MQRIVIELNTKTGITYVSLENIAYVEVGGPQPDNSRVTVHYLASSGTNPVNQSIDDLGPECVKQFLDAFKREVKIISPS